MKRRKLRKEYSEYNQKEARIGNASKAKATPQSGCSWWNRKAKKYGNKRGQDILRDFVQTLEW